MNRTKLNFVVTAIALIVLFALDLWTGSVRLSFGEVWRALTGGLNGLSGGFGNGIGGEITGGATGNPTGNATDSATDAATFIVRNFRLPKALTAVLAGAALGASGLQMQTLFRNPLAGPYVLGVSSGASLGVAIFLLGTPTIASGALLNVGMAGAAWIGAGLIFVLIAAVSHRIRDIMAILIIGMMLGSVAGAATQVLQYFGTEGALKSFVVWTMGSLGGVTLRQLAIMAPMVLAALANSAAAIKPLDAMLLGENYARTMGIDTGRVRTMVFINTTLLAGTVTAFCGPIGFLGLAVPHIARMVSGAAGHRILMPLSMLMGATVMLLCDILSSVVGANPLPINTITALVGIPVIILVVVRNRKFF
jgi:iron complex transport system permease protein